ncbi:uncharacterized protein LOC126907513 isoform X2 [Daktulosphaira vitifoliae]|uniref:uncharacterized protein LOC126907513 isoform X2 n=1 Tax=Daktulosphaira vitifoliae TaxID=58002 RepID=UPI0021AABCD4|nr:uncharacterized protein LOC126907513 isoform X2 [Daktulosphaira vitifoliae]
MITLRLYIIFLKYTNFIVAIDLLGLHCNFSKYMFNLFKHGEQYLFNFKNTISELELRNYGLAIKSHDEIIMIMLDALRHVDEQYTAADLMSINLYLNNVSGSLNMIAKNKNGEFSRSESSQNLLEGYKIIHRSIVERLEYFISSQCSVVSFENDFISYTYFKIPYSYNPNNLLNDLEHLKNYIFIVMREYLLWYDMNYDEMLKSYNDIVKHLALSFRRKSYSVFNPKYFLFYDLMETRSNLCELELSSGSQAKQYARYKSDKQLVDILDMVRYAPFHKWSTNNYQIKLFDVFRFIKFDFDLQNVQAFKNLVNTATVRPIMLIVRFYFSLVRKFILIPKFKNNQLKYKLKYNIIDMGQHIVEIMKSFMDLNLFGKEYTAKIEYGFHKTYELISFFIYHNNLFLSKDMQSISKFFFDYMRKNCLDCSIGELQNENVTEDSISRIYYLAVEEVSKIVLFVSELKKYQYCFETANKYIPIGNISMRIFGIIFKQNIPFEQLGNHEDIYRPLYFPGVNTTDMKKHNNHSSNYENYEMNNYDNKVFDNGTQSYYTPIYLVDYLLYQ